MRANGQKRYINQHFPKAGQVRFAPDAKNALYSLVGSVRGTGLLFAGKPPTQEAIVNGLLLYFRDHPQEAARCIGLGLERLGPVEGLEALGAEKDRRPGLMATVQTDQTATITRASLRRKKAGQ